MLSAPSGARPRVKYFVVCLNWSAGWFFGSRPACISGLSNGPLYKTLAKPNRMKDSLDLLRCAEGFWHFLSGYWRVR
jgi:hypothetical protein